MAVTLYRQVGKVGKARRYQKVNLGRGRRPADLTGPYFLRYSLAKGTRPREAVGNDLDEATAARDRWQKAENYDLRMRREATSASRNEGHLPN